MNTITFTIDGMQCDGCAARLQTRLEREPGVRAARVSFAAGAAEIRYNPAAVDEARLRAVVDAAGFGVVEPAG